MNFIFIRQFTHYTKSQRLGILSLLITIFILQGIYFSGVLEPELEPVPRHIQQWLADTQDKDTVVKQYKKPPIYPFNPNFLTDYKAYKWGMSTQEYQRLVDFRKQNKYVNSAQEFQTVTQVPDAVLNKMKVYFKFPAWVNAKSKQEKFIFNQKTFAEKKMVPKDINAATDEDFVAIRGIGEVLAERILKYRSSLGAFVSMEQLDEVYGLKPEVITELNEHFTLLKYPDVVKIKINEATIKELGQFPYFRYPVSRNIVAYRSMNGDLTIEELTNVKGINLEKLKIIALYLEF
ncbi:ComEA family DNA-binding protein [Flavobacterium stagni]|uniref:Helix-hairpin-helix domain-containing protein n=1 Tax=Flavobacterium stagni TaxID=2506421 RepID=A0A4Q1K8H0_9FLAO|nr:helix-hairpin-helix domain-containing protein [Flavobacterium stagni]RXR22118.1 helix-hairpin-helix domain-containing protein [Flavobacterium stagni]